MIAEGYDHEHICEIFRKCKLFVFKFLEGIEIQPEEEEDFNEVDDI